MSRTWATWEPAFILSESGACQLAPWRIKYNCIYIFHEITINVFGIDRRLLPKYSLSCKRA
ncbi:hypothetical protein FW320_05900 [Azospirillum sp. Vi22]|nr:hypothetical protein [Azospirillum baldaniorum]